jgi:hypothetical protein
MTTVNRLSVKFYLTDASTLEWGTLIPIFHRWIQTHAVEGLLIDVTDYKHVPQGPGLLLIGHEGDYAIDESDGRLGLRYILKREPHDSLASQLATAIRRLQGAIRQLETDLPNLSFETSIGTIQFLDRLNAPNTPEFFAQAQAELGETFQLEAVTTDPRAVLTINFTAKALVGA